MNNQSANWITSIKEALPAKSGSFTTHDANGNPVIIEWEKIEGQSPRLTEKIKEVADILAYAYSKQEIEFARVHPEAVPNEYFLKAIAPLFSEGVENVDWQKAEEQLMQIFTHMFSTADFAQYASPSDISLFVVAKDAKSNQILGLNQFLITPEFPYGTVKSAYFGIAQEAQARGVEKLLMSIVFKLIPDTKRIFMHTRTTNQNMIALYQSWGFTEFPGTLAHWIDLEYVTEKSEQL